MSVQPERLVEYNSLLKKHGFEPVKEWKGSDKSFEARIAKLRSGAIKPYTKEDLKKAKVKDKPQLRLVKTDRDSAAAEPASRKKANGEDTVSLSSICEDLDKDAKAVRAKLRKLYASGTRGLPKPVGSGWSFLPKDVKAVKEMLRK